MGAPSEDFGTKIRIFHILFLNEYSQATEKSVGYGTLALFSNFYSTPLGLTEVFIILGHWVVSTRSGGGAGAA